MSNNFKSQSLYAKSTFTDTYPDPTIYSVSTNLAELHMEDVGLSVEWHNVPISESLREEVWKGVKRRYWDLPGYSLPVARMG